MPQKFRYDQIIPEGIPFEYQVSMGKVPGFYTAVFSGVNNNIDSSLSSLWQADVLEANHAAAHPISFVSTSTSDSSAGTGVRQIEVRGLDNNFNLIQEVMTTNGTTPVISVQSFRFVNTVNAISVGSSGTFAGDATLTQTVSNEMMGNTLAGTPEMNKCTYTVPDGYTALIVNAYAKPLTTTNNVVRISLSHASNDSFTVNIATDIVMNTVGSQEIYYQPRLPLIYPPKTFIQMISSCQTATVPVTGRIELMLFPVEQANLNNIYGVEP